MFAAKDHHVGGAEANVQGAGKSALAHKFNVAAGPESERDESLPEPGVGLDRRDRRWSDGLISSVRRCE